VYHGERFNGYSHLAATLLAATGVCLLLALGAGAMDAWQVTGVAIYGATLLFLFGASFAHFVVFPWAWTFFASFATDYAVFMPKIASTFSLYAKMIVAFGVVFQLPTVVFFLARAGLVTHRTLIRQARIATLVAFILGALLTPPDAVSQVLLAGPIMALYGVGILIAWLFGRRPDAGA